MRHPVLASMFLLIFFLWPIALIAWKATFPATRWLRLWFTVPLVSWLTVNAAVRLDYPASGGGGGFGLLFNLIVGWAYLIPVFAVLQLCFLFAQRLRQRFNKPA